MLADMCRHNLSMLRVGVGKDILDEVVAVLIAGNVDQRDTWAINTTLTDSIKVSTKELRTTNLQTLLDYLRGKLVHRVLGGIANDMINCTAPVRRSSMLADMLDAPVAELAMRDNVDVGENFLDTWALRQAIS